MTARKIQDEAEAKECIAKIRESGLTLAQWARSAGIDGRSLHAWNVNLARGGSGVRQRTTETGGTRRMKLVELEADGCNGRGQLGELLRREGLTALI